MVFGDDCNTVKTCRIAEICHCHGISAAIALSVKESACDRLMMCACGIGNSVSYLLINSLLLGKVIGALVDISHPCVGDAVDAVVSISSYGTVLVIGIHHGVNKVLTESVAVCKEEILGI